MADGTLWNGNRHTKMRRLLCLPGKLPDAE